MGPDQVVDLVRRVLLEAFIIGMPLLLITCAVSIVVSIVQTLTGIQEQSLTTVPRLVVVFIAILISLPWIIHRVVNYTTHLFSDFRIYFG
jgi:flagellar biosynthesis protein FliQ